MITCTSTDNFVCSLFDCSLLESSRRVQEQPIRRRSGPTTGAALVMQENVALDDGVDPEY